MSEKNRVAIYIRVSTLHQVDRDSLPMQRADLAAYSRLILNTDDYTIFEDAGYSGKDTDRPKYQEMMGQIRSGLFTHLLVWKIDRISRNLIDFSTMYAELKELGVTFVSKSEQFDTSTAVGEAMLKIILVFAELERKMTAERVTATMISRAGKGLWNGGRIPFGYEYDKDNRTFSINEEESAIVRRIFDDYEASHSIHSIVCSLNSENILTRSGRKWSPTTVDLILRNVFYAGDYRYNAFKGGDRSKSKNENEWIISKDHHPAVIKRRQFDSVQSTLTLNRRHDGTRTKKKVHVFADHVKCAYCGRIMMPYLIRNKGDWIHSGYKCPDRDKGLCDNSAVVDTVIGEYASNFILNILNARRDRLKITTVSRLEDYLISGSCFSHVSGIKKESLEELFTAIKSYSHTDYIFDEDYRTIRNAKHSGSSIANLKAQRTKHKQALDRLTSLFLYSSAAMPEQEYISRREELELKISKINEKIVSLSSSDLITEMPRIDYDSMAGRFIITEKFSGKNHVNYKRIAMDVDAEILKDFFASVLSYLEVKDGMVTKIVFNNGLYVDFKLKGDAKRFSVVRKV